ncbi:PAS domain S-box protein [Octadecabacter sp. G9-8]|uniref:histidine kinase n=1 Tax=Octadecabacter dasysiphoniae TaxID=2909341 RepID=A0ABS9CTU6_9RHOB|nr:PAS domain S-box protein [Octadecabacter dasysiphoniae]MCF2870497.1 PAS domain S-box protein [Octadecabacter dasysiphoniae]
METSLTQLSLVDSPATEDFDRFTRLATRMLGVPVALVSIVDFDKDRQFFTSACGLGEPWASQRQTPLTHSFCQHVVAANEPLVIEDARIHPLVSDNLAIRDLNVVAYLGIPVTAPDGRALGALCAIDTRRRAWSEGDISILNDLGGSVTSQIGLRAALLASESSKKAASQFGSAVENSHHEVFMFEADTLKFTTVNKGARFNLGYDIAELRELTPVDIKPEFSQLDFDTYIERLRTGSVPNLEFETKHARKDGSTYPVSIRLELHNDSNMFIAFVEDITERRKLEKALAKETASFLSFFQYAPEPMTVSAMDTTILQANPASERLFGLSSENLLGTQFLPYIPEDSRPEVQLGFSQATPDNPFYSVLLEQVMNGIPKSLIWSNVVQFEDGKPSRIFSIANDVTELYEAKTLAESSASEAKRAMEIRKVFLANMSHEVRTPLNAIMGLFQLIQMADVPERQKKQAKVGLDASHHLLAQLVNVLELSRVEANAVEIEPKPTDIRSLAEQWFETASATNHRLGKPIELSLEIDETTPQLAVLDERRVTQILNNLTDNALKFTKEGRVTIQVGQVSNTDVSAPQQLEISVSDTGCGIACNKREAVFERFVQIDDAQTRENSGSGLGLAISRELAVLMGGALDVTCPSPDDCYATTFSLRLQSFK